MSQPLAPMMNPESTPAEVDTWANLDAVTIYTPVLVNLVKVEPLLTDYNGAFTNDVWIKQLTIFDPAGPSNDNAYFGRSVTLGEIGSQRGIVYEMGHGNAELPQNVANVWAGNGFVGGGAVNSYNSGTIIGGVLSGFPVGPSGFAIGSDTIIGASGTFATSSTIWFLYLDTGVNLNVNGLDAVLTGAAVVWGPGTFNTSTRVVYAAGATGGATQFKTPLQINGQTKGCIMQPGAAAIGACNTATGTGANLDTANGATTGCLGTIGGGAFCNYGP